MVWNQYLHTFATFSDINNKSQRIHQLLLEFDVFFLYKKKRDWICLKFHHWSNSTMQLVFFMAKSYSFLSICDVKKYHCRWRSCEIVYLLAHSLYHVFWSMNLSCDDKTIEMHSFCREMFFASGNVYIININIESFNLWRRKKRQNKINTLLILVSCNIKNSEMITSNQ